MDSLVSIESLEDMLGLTFGAEEAKRAQGLLTLASGEVESYCTAVSLKRLDNDTVSLRGRWGSFLELAGPPIHNVTEALVDGVSVSYKLTRDGLISSSWGGPTAIIEITYDHGLNSVPKDVRSMVLSRVVRAFSNPEAVMQKGIGSDYSVSYAADAEMITALNKSERMSLRRYRRKI